MRRGGFERHEPPDGEHVFRLRWEDGPTPLTVAERQRLEFLRYLLRVGRVSEQTTER